jgi:hypothetical protein
MTYTIEKNIPIPSSARAVGASKYPWEQLMILDSFAVPLHELNSGKSRPTPPESLMRKGYRVQTRKLLENGVWVVRVWRIN